MNAPADPSIIVITEKGEICPCCRDQMASEFSFFDADLHMPVCPECRYRLTIATVYLKAASMPVCTQVSGNKPLKK